MISNRFLSLILVSFVLSTISIVVLNMRNSTLRAEIKALNGALAEHIERSEHPLEYYQLSDGIYYVKTVIDETLPKLVVLERMDHHFYLITANSVPSTIRLLVGESFTKNSWENH